MQTPLGLAFAWQSLSPEQRNQIKGYWLRLPQRRYLLPWEMCKILNREAFNKTIKPEEEQSMKLTWLDWCKAKNEPQDALPFDHGEWFDWLDYAAANYAEPLPAVPVGDWRTA